ncbi:hypothetical protein MAR_037305 [Mya arenaria]|uniref:Uncharacterized protein n=1 Tax=Mya arenaria TaxID=6604 RepID=A0ABY7FWU1_MYAAR|nr:hypothetical protein MAR_037305 [Mya arenaria]
MRRILYLTLMVFLASVEANGRHSQFRKEISGSTSQKARLGGPNNNILPDGQLGVPQPSPDCVMTWQDFATHVVGKTWLAIYNINGYRDLFPVTPYGSKITWTVTGERQATRDATLWQPADSSCLNLTSDFERTHPTKAIMAQIVSGVISNRVDTLVSNDPSKYLIFHICYDITEVVAGKCPKVFVLLMIPKKSIRSIGEPFVIEDDLGWEWAWRGTGEHFYIRPNYKDIQSAPNCEDERQPGLSNE